MANIPRSMTLQKWVFRASVALGIISFLLVVSLIWWHRYDQRQVVDSAKDTATQKALGAANEIATVLAGVSTLAHTIADDLSTGRLSDDQVEERLIRELELDQGLGAVTACYSPEFVPEAVARRSRKLYCPYSYTNEEGTVYIERVEDYYDYTQPDGSMIGPAGTPIRTAWYLRPLKEGPVWGEPFFGSDHTNYWGGFGAPFYRNYPSSGGPALAGIVDVSLTLGRFQDLVSGVDLGKPGAGYGFIISHTGAFVYHPIVQFIEGEQNISDFDPSLSIEVLRQMAERLPNEVILVVDHLDQKSARSSWLFLAPIPSSGWWVGIVLDKEQIFNTKEIIQRSQRQILGIAMGTLAFLFFLSVLLFRAQRGTVSSLWAVSCSFSVICTAGIAFLWFTNITAESEADDRNIFLIDPAIAAKVASDYAFAKENDPIYVPTGMFIQSIEFISANNVALTGYLWQKFSEETPDSIKKIANGGTAGFILPESTSISVTESYREEEGSHTLVGWNFNAVIRQNFDFSKYPFDRKELWIRIWPKDFGQGVVLTPDLIAYGSTDPNDLPGLEQEDFVIEGWDLSSTFFSYRQNSYDTNFGKQTFVGQKNLPELYFNVRLKRQFVNAFVSNLIPLFAVTILLFAVLMLIRASEEGRQVFGFSTASVLSFCAGLFFIVILAHLNLRSSIGSQGIIYLESFYFVTYLALLSVALNSILTSSPAEFRLIKFRDNFITRILYWPMFSGLLLIITLFAFA